MTAALLAVTVLVACTGPTTSGPTAGPSAVVETGSLYLSLGDSYAAGFQPDPIGSTQGFAQQIAERSTTGSDPLTLINLGCPGATTSAVIEDVGCVTADSVADGSPYPSSTQLDSALNIMRTHEGEIGLVTISLGGNDISLCLNAIDPLACAEDLAPTIERNLDQVLTQVRQAVGPDLPIVGITYPDVYVKDLDSPDPVARARAQASVEVFRDVLNPVLAAAYARVGAGFVDITADSGAYRPVDDLVQNQDGSTVPAAVAAVCRYTHYCDSGDVHPTTAGYSFIADQVLALVAARP